MAGEDAAAVVRVAIELLDRFSRVRSYLSKLGPGESQEHERLIEILSDAIDRVASWWSGVLPAKRAENPRDIKPFESALLRKHAPARWFSDIHERLVYLPPHSAPPELFEALRDSFGELFQQKRPSVILGSVFNAYEFDFIGTLFARLPNLGKIASEPQTVLQLAMCDVDSPTSWPVLAHEMGHALDAGIAETVAAEVAAGRPRALATTTSLAEELWADLVAAHVLGPAPLLSLLAMYYCMQPVRPAREKDRATRGAMKHIHPPMVVRVRVVSEYLERFGPQPLIARETIVFESLWNRWVKKSVPDPVKRSEWLDGQKRAFDLWIAPLVPLLEQRIKDLGLRPYTISDHSLDRCRKRLLNGYPIGAQGLSKQELNHELDLYKVDAPTMEQQPERFQKLAAKFREEPVRASTIFVSGHAARIEIIERLVADGRLPSREEFAATVAELDALEQPLSHSFLTASVHKLLTTTLPYEYTTKRRDFVSPKLRQEGPTILSDFEILRYFIADEGDTIFLTPVIDPEIQVGPSSFDLRLGTELKITRTSATSHIDLTLPPDDIEKQVREYLVLQRVKPDGSFVLHPGQFALATTLEYLHLPLHIAGRLEGRSTPGRLGIQIHATAGFVDPGFRGNLTFELSNAGNLPVRISPGYRLGQICFFPVTNVQVPYDLKPHRKYGHRFGVEPAAIHLEPEFRVSEKR